MECKFCNGKCQKAGRQKNGKQKLYCIPCKKYQQLHYRYKAYEPMVQLMVPKLVCESVGIRGMARVLQIAINTVVKRILELAASIAKPPIPLKRQCFEVDELRTYIGNKGNQYWIAYALCSETKQVVDFVVGKRTKRTLKVLINNLLLTDAIIKTDGLNIYQSLVPGNKHICTARNTNHIERHNLNLRTHLKRLGRNTICYSKNFAMLEACTRIYFWYRV